MIGYYGFKKIYRDEKLKDTFRILMTVFTINHLVHFFFVFQNFKSHALELSITENLHGFITFIFIVIAPVFLWLKKDLNTGFYVLLALHLFNASYFIMQTFLSKVSLERPAYHNQLGILVTSIALSYVLYRFFRENKTGTVSGG